MYNEGRFDLNILTIDIGINFEFLWNISIFGRNSCVSKVLTHEMSDEVEKNLNFQVSLYDEWISLHTLGKFLSAYGIFQFLFEILEFQWC